MRQLFERLPSQRNYRAPRRRGAILVLSAFLLVVMVGFVAFAVDMGYITNIRTDLQRAADASACAGAGALVDGTDKATQAANAYLVKNTVGNRNLTTSDATVSFGNWNTASKTFTETANGPSAVRVIASSGQQPLFFARIFSRDGFTSSAQAICVFQPRDIALVLDYSGSMCYDSQFRNVSLLGLPAIQANLQQIHQELGSPTFGSLTWTPVSFGSSNTSANAVKNHFNLNSVSYPYPGGSWDEYIDYVQNDSYVNSAGYRCKYGYMTWVNYLLAKQCGAAATPGLAATSEQPVTALKDAVDVFLSYLSAHKTNDRVGLSIYTYSDQKAKQESGLTNSYSTISSICRARQAGHYTGGTNISAGMTKARLELQTNGRAGAKRVMVLMTDGVVNLPSGNTTSDKQKVIDEANLAATAGIPIITIALGAYADTALMQQVADITGGAAFVVAGGQPIANVKTQLEDVFGQVAADRPLKLVE